MSDGAELDDGLRADIAAQIAFGNLSAPLARWDLGADVPHVLSGYTDSEKFTVALPPGWIALDDARFDTSIVASQIARADASLRFDIDGRPATTWTLADTSSVSLMLDPDLFSLREFDIYARTTSPIIAEPECVDPEHVGRWVDLGSPEVTASIVPFEMDVARAIRGMASVSALTNQPINLVLTDEPSAASIEALGSVAAAIGQYGAPAGWIVSQGDSVLPPGGSVIVIDESPDNAGEISVAVDSLRPVVKLSGDAEALPEIAKALADPGRLLFFHERWVHLDSVPQASAYLSRDVFTFEAAGYDDRVIRGYGTQGLQYRIHVPAGPALESATLALYGSYSPQLGALESIIFVSVNGHESEIVAVADATGRIEVLHPLEATDLRPGLNFIQIDAQLGQQRATGCISDTTTVDNWFLVSESSAVGISRPDAPASVLLGVNDARFALASASDFDETDIALRNDASLLDLGVAVRLIAEMANRAEGGSPRLVRDRDVDLSRHLVVIGASQGRDFLIDVPYSDRNSSVGVIVAQGSPYAAGRIFLAFTGGTDADAARAARVGMTAEVNDISSSLALVSIDTTRAIGQDAGADSFGPSPADLAFAQDDSAGPPVAEYEDWIVQQAARIESANAPETSTRRAVAFGLLILVAIVGGLWWIRRIRSNDTAAAPSH